jgi:aarF domain-containing kinase
MRIFKDYRWLKVPKIIWKYTTPRVLVMEFEHGGQVNNIEYIKANKLDPYDISNKIGLLYSNMIFVHGFVHSDPHPGNIFVRKGKNGGTEIVLLDHGLYAVSTDQI